MSEDCPRFDPKRARLDLNAKDALGLTSVSSVEDYRRLLERLPELKGSATFYISMLDGEPRLVLTVIVCEGCTVTDSFPLDIDALGISRQDLLIAVEMAGGRDEKSGLYSLSPGILRQIEEALKMAEAGGPWHFKIS